MKILSFDEIAELLAKKLVEELDGGNLCEYLEEKLDIDAEYKGDDEWLIGDVPYFEDDMQNYIAEQLQPIAGKDFASMYNEISDDEQAEYVGDSIFELK